MLKKYRSAVNSFKMVTSELKEDPMLANYDIKNYGACYQWRTSKSTCSAQTCVGSQPAFRSLGSSRHTFAENGCLEEAVARSSILDSSRSRWKLSSHRSREVYHDASLRSSCTWSAPR
ncbi:hypothetical protein SLEP1_g42688 [Rubroshorea leprosula]|uniref:Uncharacterized protein n=1 Tax=Rubroshorea leprosula TaxID=152421 RepID=A0AAV5LAQ2_9ROSI|nr:hypothetical protein SLEP1_g42688 [Rubroshorea leprosula]